MFQVVRMGLLFWLQVERSALGRGCAWGSASRQSVLPDGHAVSDGVDCLWSRYIAACRCMLAVRAFEVGCSACLLK
jgi:hypothetical protein